MIVLIVIAVLVLLTSLRTVQQYERGLVFRFGRLRPKLRSPGLTLVVPFGVDHIVKVNMRIVAMSVPTQECITRDNVTLTVEAVVYFRVIDPVKAIVNVENYTFAVTEVAQTSLRSVIGRSELDQLLSDQERVNAELRAVIDEPTEKPWGVKIERVELKDLALPESMKRSMSKQAEAERERRARVITAEGEFQASRMLAQAGRVLAADPSGLQLRLLQTVVEVAAEKNSTLVMPIPVELLRFFDRVVPVADPTDTAGPQETQTSS
ncbi:SPFH domain-containing protein [Frankia sp. Cas3]|uniref:SPFH domain-containing protein n=1 Tax=Frankia sp. Cas3 TaxID=3073926 RepID=UPI003A0FEAB3